MTDLDYYRAYLDDTPIIQDTDPPTPVVATPTTDDLTYLRRHLDDPGD
jgi:hypothetical protein